MDHQSRTVDFRRHPGVNPGAAPVAVRHRNEDARRALFLPAVFRVDRDRRRAQSGAQPDRACLCRNPRSGYCRRDHRHRHLSLQIDRFAISSFYAGVCGVLYTYYFGIANYEQFQLGVSIEYLAMIIIGGLGSVLGSILGAAFVALLPLVIRTVMESVGGFFFAANEMATVVSSMRLVIFGALIIVFLVLEPEGLNRLWRNIRNYFRVWPFSY